MGERGPIANPHGRRAEQRMRRLKLAGAPPPRPPATERRERISMPADVRTNAEARKFWKQHARMLVDLGRLAPEYRATFVRLCLAHARLQQYSAQIEQDGAMIEGPRGGRSKHPLLTALRQAEATYTELSGKFGLDPKSAQRLPSPAQTAQSRRARLLSDNDGWDAFKKYTPTR